MASGHKKAQRFERGDWVAFRFGKRDVIAQVAEVRGALGLKGRRLYRIRIPQESGEIDFFEMPEDELREAAAPTRRQIVDYLSAGGLVGILRANLSGGGNQPRSWLTFTQRGEVTHTFDPACGLIGGSTIPFLALYGDRVFAPKETDVMGFLRSFGLSPTDAAEVLASVGTAP